MPKPSTGRPSTGVGIGAGIGAGVVGGGAAAEFLKNRDAGAGPGQRPGIDPVRPGPGDGLGGNRPGDGLDGNRPGDGLGGNRPGDGLAGNRPGDGLGGNRPGDGLAGNRPDRIDNRQERFDHRQGRRDEVRDQFDDNHPRYDFWKGNPNWARWRWNRPYRWATWGLVTGWFPWGWNEPVYYSYGDNVYYEDDTVYYGEDAYASADDYAAQAQTLAASAPAVDDTVEWLPLGVFAVTQDGEESGPPPTLFVQLTVNKQGIIAGTFTNTATDKSQPIEGMIDEKTQRCAWTIVDQQWPIMETGISSLTEDATPVLVHFEDGQTQQWLLVRLEEPEGDAATE